MALSRSLLRQAFFATQKSASMTTSAVTRDYVLPDIGKDGKIAEPTKSEGAFILAQAQRDAKIDMLKLEEAQCRSELKLISGGVVLFGAVTTYSLYKKYADEENSSTNKTPGPSFPSLG